MIITAVIAIMAIHIATARPLADAPMMRESFRSSGRQMSAENRVVDSRNVHGFLPAIGPELSEATLPGDWGDYLIQPMTGVNAIRFSGSADGDDAFCDLDAYHVSLSVRESATLGYWIYPQQENAAYVAINLHCTDGSTLRDAMKDEARAPLPARKWSHVTVPIGKWLRGKTIDRIWIGYSRRHGGGQFRGYIEDIFIGAPGKEPDLRKIAHAHAPSHAAWIDRSVIYLINPRTFSSQGGFSGITAQLDRLYGLGLRTLWIMPVMPPGQLRAFGSPYSVKDFYAVNPAYGGMEDLKALVVAAHSRGLRVILDFPLNHTSWDNALVKDHPEWFRHSDDNLTDPGSISRTLWWSDVAQLDYDNAAVREYMIAMQRYWLKTCDLDGFRYDSAELIPNDFWDQLSSSLRKVKPDILLLGESSRPETMTGAFNVDYSFSLYTALAAVIKGRQPASAIRETLEWDKARYPAGSLHMRYIENNDTRQAAAEFGKNASRAAAVLEFCLDGIPMIQGGQEAGDDTEGSFIDRKPIAWEKADTGTASFYKELLALRNTQPALQTGTLRWIDNSAPEDLLTFVRAGSNTEMFVVINLTGHESHAKLQLPADHMWNDVTPSLAREDGRTKPPRILLSEITLAPWSFRVFQRPRK